MLTAYRVFLDEIRELESYINMIESTAQLLQNDFSKSKAVYKNTLLLLQQQSQTFNKRKLDYSLVIVTLYGAFEQYIESFIKNYLMMLVSSISKYSELPDIIIDEHINLSVELIQKIDYPKYVDILNKEQIIKNLNDCLQDDKLTLNYEAFCMHSANYRIGEIQKTLKRVGLGDLVNKIKKNEKLRELYVLEKGECDYEGLPLESIFSFVNELADRRNRISHGSITDILSLSLQKDLIERIKLFAGEMDSLCFENLLKYLVNDCCKIEKIYNVNKKTKLLCFKLENARVTKGDVIIRKKNEKFSFCLIEGIEVSKVAYDQIKVDKPTDVAVKLDRYRKEDEEYWLYNFST